MSPLDKKENASYLKNIRRIRHISLKILKIYPLYAIIIIATQSNRFLPLWENTLAKGVFSIYSYHNGGDCVATMRDYTFSVRSLVVGAHFFVMICNLTHNTLCKFREIYKGLYEQTDKRM